MLEYCQIELTQGQIAIVSPEDWEELTKHKWYATRCNRNMFYAARTSSIIDGKKHMVFMHRQVLGLQLGDELQGDHINMNTLDNRRENLRVATNTENNRNQRRRASNSSGFKGVSRFKPTAKWQVHIRAEGKKINLGLFSTPELAHEAYCAAATKYHGEFARLQ